MKEEAKNLEMIQDNKNELHSNMKDKKSVQQQIVWLKNLLREQIDVQLNSIEQFIALFDLKKEENQTKYSISSLHEFIALFKQQHLERNLSSNLYQSAMNELAYLVQMKIEGLVNGLTDQERDYYERIAKFNQISMSKFESKVKYPQQVYSIKGMLNFNILALFFWKNHQNRQKYGFQCLIPQRIANNLLKLTSTEYNRFEERFLEVIQFIELKFVHQFDTSLNLFCLMTLKKRLAIMQRKKYIFKSINDTMQKEIQLPKLDQDIYFQFCEIAVFPSYSKKTSEHKSSKIKEQITRKMQGIANITNKRLIKTELLKIKIDNNFSLKFTLQFFNQIRQNPEKKIIVTPYQKGELYRQLEHTKWIYFTNKTMYSNLSNDLKFYLQDNRLRNQLSPSAIIIFKIAMQRYKLMQSVNTSLIKLLKIAKKPITFINRHVFSFRRIKGIEAHGEQSLITVPLNKKDVMYAHILGVRSSSVNFSALSDLKMVDSQYSAFLLEFCGKKLNIHGQSVVLYEFEHNRQVSTEAFTKALKGFKSSMSSDIIIVNNLNMFIIHYFVNLSVEWLLRSRSQELTTDNFGQMIKIAQAQILNAFIKARETIQHLLDEAINEQQQTHQSFFASMLQKLFQILIQNQDEEVFLIYTDKYQHCNHTVQYWIQPNNQSIFDKKNTNIPSYELIALQKKAELGNYLRQQLMKRYAFLDDYDKEETNTNFSLLLEKYSMTSTDVKNILSRCCKYILIAEVLMKVLQQQIGQPSIDILQAKQFQENIQFLKKIFGLQREKIQFIYPNQRSIFLKRALCMSRYSKQSTKH